MTKNEAQVLLKALRELFDVVRIVNPETHDIGSMCYIYTAEYLTES